MTDPKTTHIPVKDMWRMVFGIIYIYLWIKRTNFRRILEKYAFGFLSLSLVLLLIELGLEIVGRHLATGSTVLKVLFGISFTIAAWGKYREWKEERDDFYFIGAARAIALALSRPIESTDVALDALLKIFHTNFSGPGEVNVTLALKDEDTKGVLRITQRYPATPEDRPTRFEIGLGGAGYAFKEQCLVYIPRKKLGHAVVQRFDDDDPYEMVTKLFFAFDEEDRPYRAILSVPVILFGTCSGVLNFDSTKPNAFRKKHIQQAFYFATVVAQVLQSTRPTAANIRSLDRKVDRV
ncbi:MAG: hypothetical protein QOH06_5209 [Acidobacteriota bacterium]|jgi:hypothetical protein|nr:hypothetical protein [Acidobacteriota bacterium]